jgi:gamma-glutamylputrescine oxidase
MNFSYWEIKSWLTNVDFTIVGSGIVGLTCGLELRKRFPKAKILILEKGVLPQGASTKNAGFACFGSLSELIDDLQSNRDAVNKLLHPVFNAPVFALKENSFHFKKIKDNYSFNPFEGQIDTGKMMTALLQLVLKKNIKILNNISVKDISETTSHAKIKTNLFEMDTSKVFVATNGFASQLLNENVQPARAQVLITKPLENLSIKGTFHLDKGYYYFRNIDNRILLGGGRNLDFKGEETTDLNQSTLIQNKLEELLRTIILPNTPLEIDHRWSGIMGIGNTKNPVVKQLGNHMFCGVRLGGMGVAIGSLIGKDLAGLLD